MLVKYHASQHRFIKPYRSQHCKLISPLKHVAQDDKAHADAAENEPQTAQNLEYGGYVYRNPDGSYSSTKPVRGTPSSVLIPPISQIVPGSSVARAAYHTHAGPDPRFDNENFSPADISVNIAFGLDGYLGTPAGAFKFHDISAGSITTLGKIAN